MFRRAVPVVILIFVFFSTAVYAADSQTREFPASAGGTLVLDLDAGGSVRITGTGGSSITVSYEISGSGADNCRVEFTETGDGLEVRSRLLKRKRHQNLYIEFDIELPDSYNVKFHSAGGGLEIDGVDGDFSGKTMGGALTLHDVRGEAKLTTMGGQVQVTDSELDGSIKTMGGKMLFENVIGDLEGSSMGGNVRYKNVQRRDGTLGSPARTGHHGDHGVHGDLFIDTVQISTMGGGIEVEDAPEGADLHTMGGNIQITDAQRFVRAKTMGGDIVIEAVDGSVTATTMGGDIEVTMVGTGGDVELTSMTGDITLHVPSGFSMDLDLELAYTRNSKQDYRIEIDAELQRSESAEWDHDRGSPRKYRRAVGSVAGGQNRVKIRTINGDIRVK